MRSFDDSDGHHWQAALMQASFGNVLVVFSRIGDQGVLHKPFDAANLYQAEQQLAKAEDTALCQWLAEATPWP